MALKCPFSKCKTGELPVDNKNVVEHIIVTKDKENHYHVHGPMKDKSLIQEFVVHLLKEANIAYNVVPGPKAEEVSKDNKSKD